MRSTLPLFVALSLLLVAPAIAADFVPGDKLYLTPRPSGPVVLTFDGVPDMKVTFKVKRSGDSSVLTRLELVAPGGTRSLLGTASTSSGKIKAKPVLDEAGTWSIEFHSADGSVGDIKVKTKTTIPDRASGTVVVPLGDTVEFPFDALAGSSCKIKLKGAVGPSVDAFEGPGGGLTLVPTSASAKKLKAEFASLPSTGRYVLTIGGTTGGDLKVRIKISAPEGDGELDLRLTADSGLLLGNYDGGVLGLAGAVDAEFAVLFGGLTFDGVGGFTHGMERVSVVLDDEAEGGFRLESEIPGGAVPGTYDFLDGVATLDFEPGTQDAETAVLDVLLGGRVLLPRGEAGQGAGTGFFARKATGLQRDDLDGEFLYLFLEQSIRGEGEDEEIVVEVEAGLVSLSDGSILGGGLLLTLVLDDGSEGGFQVESQETVAALGSYSIDSSGEASFNIRRTLFGSGTTRELTALADGDLLFSANVDEGAETVTANLMMRQGSDVENSDAVGNYRHTGSRTAADSGDQVVTTRTGRLTLDGQGGFTGTETVVETRTSPGEDPVVDELGELSQAGTYSIGSFDVQSAMTALLGGADVESLLPLGFGFQGESQLAGIVGPNADYLMAFSIEGGLGFDLLIRE